MVTASARYAISLIMLISMAACGGGGGGGGGETSPPPPPPPAATHSIGGSVTDLQGTGLLLQNNGGDNLAVSQSGNFSFATEINDGSPYAVTVLTQPGNPAQTCSVANGSGTANADVSNVTVTCVVDTTATDTDGDGISDADEINIYGTAPDDPDTDGDSYLDGDELSTFDPDVNNFRFNPVVADVPDVRISITADPNIGANITEQNSSVERVETTRGQQSTSTTSTTFGASTTLGVEASQSATTGVSTTGPSAEVETNVKVTAQATVSFDATATNENRDTWQRMLANNIERSTTTSDGFVRVGIEVENAGHISFTVQALDLYAEQVTKGDAPFSGLPPLTYTDPGGFTPFALQQNSTPQRLTYGLDDIDLPTLRSLLTDTRSLKIEPGILDIRDSNTGESIELQAQEINRRTAKILIDYGPYAETELYRAATDVVPGQLGRMLSNLMDTALSIPYTQDGSGLSSVRGIDSPTGRWVVTLKRIGDVETDITTYDPLVDNYDISTLNVRSFDEVLLVLLEDPDGDGIGYREELLHGTDPNSTDTDGDGRSDFDEIRDGWTVNALNADDPNRYPAEVFSSPLVADYDGDSLSDAVELDRGLDPYNADTDGDGSPDNMDTSNGGSPLLSNLPLLLGQDPFNSNTTPMTVSASGTISALEGRVVATATIDWQSDGTADETFNTGSGGNSEIDIQQASFDYGAPGTFQVSLDAVDDDTPVNTLNETATVVITSPEAAISGLGYAAGYRNRIHVRTVADVDNDGFDDVIAISNSNTQVLRGSANGFLPLEVWSTGNWHPPIFEGVETDPRFFVDINYDGLLDIVGVDASANEVRYGINNGSGFEDPVVWVTGLNWNTSRDTAFVVDVDNSRYADFVHASVADGGVTAYTSSGVTLELTKRTTAGFSPVLLNRSRHPIRMADLDADGCADIVLYGLGDTFISQSGCNGSFSSPNPIGSAFSYDSGWRVGVHKRWVEDINGDGRPDLVGTAGAVVIARVNVAANGNIEFQDVPALTEDFVPDDGWADVAVVNGLLSYDVYPRYLADANDDGLKDIIGFAGGGAALGINQLGQEGTLTMTPIRIVAPTFARSNAGWAGERIDNPNSINPIEQCTNLRPCIEYGPRMVGDIDGDGRADLIGFSATEVIYQPMPYVTQFE